MKLFRALGTASADMNSILPTILCKVISLMILSPACTSWVKKMKRI